ncbi:MAG: beta strand repeat-containing protein [Rhodoluna sp.]
MKFLLQRRIVHMFVTMLFVVASTLLPFAVQSPAEAVSNDPAQLLNLDARQAASYPGTGTTWTDLSGQGKNATLIGSPTFSSSKLSFSGSTAYGTLPSGFSDFTKGLTVIFNADFGSVTNFERIVDLGNGTNVNNIVVTRYGTTNDLEIYVEGSYCIAPGLIVSGMHEYKIVLDGINCWMYRDGSNSYTASFAFLPSNINRTINYVGKSNWSADLLFEGSIKSLAIYNTSMLNLNGGANCEQHISRGTMNYGVTASGTDCIVTFTQGSGSWSPPNGVTSVKALIVGGGGGGGAHVGGGGGGGGFYETLNYAVTPGANYQVTVGAGGAGAIAPGGNQCYLSRAAGQGGETIFGTLSKRGGGNGASWGHQPAGAGAHGGGGSGGAYNVGGVGEDGGLGGNGYYDTYQSYLRGYPTGGGAGALGANGGGGGYAWEYPAGTGRSGDGRPGLQSTITGNYYGGGGGGGFHGGTAGVTNVAGLGGTGGGGAGNGATSYPGWSGTANTGGGGGGSGYNCAYWSQGGDGGSGIVVIKYTPSQPTALSAAANSSSSTAVNLAWTAPSSSGTVTGYQVEYSASGADYWRVASTSTSASTSAATSTTVTGLTAGTAYNFRVTPFYSSTTLAITSATASATTNLQATGSITNLTATSSGATFQVNSAGATVLSASASSGGTALTVSGPVSGVYTVSGATPGSVVDVSVTYTANSGYAPPATSTGSIRAFASVTLSGLTPTYSGSALPVSSTTVPSGLTVTYTYTGTAGTTYATSATAPTAAGSYTVQATISDATHTGSATGTLVISKADQSAVSISNASTVVYGSTLALTATGGSSSTSGYTFTKVSGPCTISGSTLSTTAAGDCIYNAFKAGDTNYNQSATTANFTTTVTPKPLTLAVTVSPTSRAYDTTNAVTLAATTVSSLSGLINSDNLNLGVDNTKLTATISAPDVGTNKAVSISVASGYLTGTAAGNYQLPTISGSPVITITQATQAAITVTSALNTIFGQNITLSATGGSGTGALTYATSSGACQIASSILTPVSAGTCVVVATRAADTNYTAQTANQTVTVAYADQTAVSMTSATTVVYGTSLTLGAQGGSGTGAYEFAKVSGNCTISSGVITPTAVGDCVVKARRAGDSGYNLSAWSSDVTISITRKPLTVVVTPFPSSREYNGSTTVNLATLSSAHVTGLVGSDSITLDNSKISATVADSAVGVNKAVTTVITAGFLGGTHAANYQEPTVSNSPTLTINLATQSTVTMSSETTFVYGSTHALTATGGTGTGALEYAVVSGDCSVSGDSLSATNAGDCVVKARRAADASYNVSAWSADQTVTVSKKPLTLAVTVSPASRAYDTTRVVTLADTTAANLTGIINSDAVTVDNSKLSATVATATVGDNKAVTVSVATGYLTGAKAGNYLLPTVTGSPTINIVKADQSTVTMTSGTTVVYGNTLTLSASGGASTAGFEFDVVSGPCTVSASTLSTTGAGTCEVRGRHVGDTNYNISAWSSNVNISVTPKPLTLAVTVDPTSRPYNTSTVVGLAATSTSNLTGIINGDTVTTDNTKLSAAVTTADVGTNKAVTVTIATGFLTGANAANYSVSSVTGTPVMTITQATQGALSWSSALATVYGSDLTLSATGGSGTGALSYATTSGPCTVASSIVTPTSVGTCVVVVTRAADTNYTAQTLTSNVVIDQAAQATVTMTNATTVVYGTPLTLTASGGSGTGAFDYAKVNGPCVVNGDVLTPQGVGDCVVHARKLSSTNYTTSAWSADLTVSITAKPLTLTVSPVDRQWNGGTGVSLATTTTSSLAGIESGDTVTVDHTKLSASVATAAVGANKAVTVTVSAGYIDGADVANYQLPTIAGYPTVNITRANQAALNFTSATSMFYGQSIALAASGGTGTGALSYSVVSGSCSISSGSLTASAAGDCVIRATKAQDSTYLVETVDYTVSVASATQAAVSVSSANTVVYGQTLTLTISGGSGSGSADYEKVSGPCSISGDTLTTTAAGDCVIHARKLSDGSYDTSAWSSDFTISITPKPITLSVTVSPTSRAYDTTRVVALAATSASNLTGIINGDSVTTDDSKLSATVSAADVGTNKAVTVAIASGYLTGTNAGNYLVSTTGTPVLTISQANQGALSWVSALSTVYGQDITLSATGGSGTGALSYAKTSGPCTVASSIVTPTSVGTCVVLVTRAADTNYTAQTLSGNVSIGQAAQSVVTATSATTVVYGSTLTLTASGGDGDGAYEFSDISGNCDVTGNVLTPLAVGDCEFHVRKLSSTNYLTSAWSTNVTVTMTPKPLTVTVSPVTRQYDGSRNIALATTTAASLTGVEAGDVLTVDHSQLSATVATAAVGSNKAVTVVVGSSYLSGADLANYQLPTVAGSPVVEITRANQAALSFTSAVSTTYGIDVSLSVSGGTGSGSVSYAVDSGPCSVSGATLTPTASGICAVTATKAQDSTYLASTVTYNVAVAAADQATVTMNNTNTVVYGSSLTLTATGGTGSGSFEYAQVSGPCAVSGTTLTSSSVGTCVVHARKLGDSGYNASAWSTDFSITVTPKPVTLSVSVSPTSRPYNTSTVVALASTSASNLTGIINNDSVGTDDTKLSASISTADVATNKAVTVAVASGYLTGTHAANYLLPTVTGTPVLTVTQTSQAVLSWTSALSTVYGQNVTLSATGGSGTGALSYATTSGPCTVASSIVTPTSVGTCVVVVTRAADTNYTAQTLSGNLEIGQATQSTVSMSNVTTVVYGSTLTLTATGGDGSGAYDFAKVNGLCAVSGDELTPLGVGDCVVHARKLSSTNFATSAWSADLTITMTAKPLTLTVSPQNRQWNGGTSIALAATTTADLSGVEAGDTLTVNDSFLSASVSTADVGVNKPVTVGVSAGYLSGVDAVNYQLPTIAGSPAANISRADQAALSFTSGTSTTFGQTLALATSGGTGTGATSYAVDSGSCAVTGSTLTSSAAGTCVVTATKAQDANYLAKTANYTVSVAYADQAAVTITNTNTVIYGSTLTLTASGGTGTGAYAFLPVSGPCTISGSTLSTTAAGDCVLKARKLGDSGYNASAWTANFTVSVTPKPLSLAVTVDPSSRQYNTSRTVVLAATSAANLTGIINSDVVTTDDTKLSALVSTADVATNKVVTVTVASGFLTGANAANYLLPTVSGTPVLSITRTAQSAITVTSALNTVFGQNISLSATGGSGTGALTFATTSGPCNVAASIMTPTSAGSCVVVATRAGDTNYFAQTQSATVDITAATQSAVSMTSATTVVYGSTLTLTATGGTGTGAYEFATVSGSACVVTNGDELTPLSVGECVVHARKAGDSSYAISDWSADVTISVTAKPLTVNVTVSPGLRQYNGSSVVALATTTSANLTGVEAGDDVSVDHSKLVATVATPAVGANKPVTVVVQSGYLVGPESGNYQLPTVTGTPLLTITQTNQSGISFANASSVPFGQSLNLVASGGSGTGALTISKTSGPCEVTNNIMTSTGVGTCAVTATRASDATYLVESTTANISITRAAQTLNFTSAVPEEPMPGDTYTPVAVSSGGAAVALNITNGLATVCTISNGVVSFLAAGQCVITASQAGTANYLAATSITQTIVAGMLNQTITFPSITDRDFGSAAFSASATVNSGLALGYSSTTGSICSVNSSGLITPLAVGTCSITISQAAGNEVYAPASPVTRTFRVLAIVPTAPQVTSVSSGDSSITVAFTPPASRGGVPITNYVLTATPTSGPVVVKSDCAAVPVATPPACTISGLTNGVNYTVVVAATNSAGTGPTSNSSPSIAPATAPDSVTSLAAVPGNTTLTASWRPPTNFGGGTFSRYELTLTPRGGTALPTVMLYSSTANRYAFTGLTNGVAYDLEVLVISTANTADMGSNRATAIGIPATESTAPRNVSAQATSSTTALVSWEVPTSNGGSPITGYSVSPAGCVFASPTATRCEYRNLTPRSSFAITVVATNVMGGSVAAETSVTLPDTPAPPVVTSRAATPAPVAENIVTPAVLSAIPEFKNAPYPGMQFDAPTTGNVIAMVDGNKVDAWMSVTGQTVTVQTEQGVKVSVQNSEFSSTSGDSLVLNPGATVQVEADGYTPGSPLEAWIFSTPVRLGEGVADGEGSFQGEFPLSSSAQLGQHTVVVHGLSTKGEVITVAIGVKVVETARAAEPQSSSMGTVMGYVLLGLLLMTALVLIINRRRSKNEEA